MWVGSDNHDNPCYVGKCIIQLQRALPLYAKKTMASASSECIAAFEDLVSPAQVQITIKCEEVIALGGRHEKVRLEPSDCLSPQCSTSCKDHACLGMCQTWGLMMFLHFLIIINWQPEHRIEKRPGLAPASTCRYSTFTLSEFLGVRLKQPVRLECGVAHFKCGGSH